VLPHGKPDFAKLKGPVLGHFGEADEFITPEQAGDLQEEIEDAGGEATFYAYERATHAFFNDLDRPERVGVHDPDAAELSWQRTISFLRETLAPAS
jgi:carboxymethylenebutenolidase